MPNTASPQSQKQYLLPVFPWLDIVFVSGLLITVALGFQLTYSKSVFRALIPQLPRQGSPLGKIAKAKGEAIARSQWDVIWIPIFAKDPIFEGDRFMTGEDSSAELNLRDDLKLTLGPDSMIQIRLRGGQFFFDLIGGQVKIKNPKHLKIAVRANGQVEEIQRTETVRETNSQQNSKPDDLDPLVQSFVPDDEPQKESDEVVGKPKPPEPNTSYPKDGTLILVQTPSTVVQIFMNLNCPDSCTLKIKSSLKDQTTASFKEGDAIFYNHFWQGGSAEKIEWFLSTDYTESSGSFLIEPFTMDNFKNAAKNKTKVEVR